MSFELDKPLFSSGTAPMDYGHSKEGPAEYGRGSNEMDFVICGVTGWMLSSFGQWRIF